MDTDMQVKREDKPLTREDVERLLHAAGSPDKLDLSGRNLEEVNLADLDLRGADLSKADLRDANLIEADLRRANLSGADLRRANLSGAILSGADLSEAILSEADLWQTDLRRADLRDANLSVASLIGAILREADLRRADLGGAALDGADLRGADLDGADLRGAIGLVAVTENGNVEDSPSVLHIRIVEEPLTAQNLTMILSALTGLHTKCWLIAKDHFTDLIQYTQTQDTRFAKEANLVITKIGHHSPVEVTLGNLDPDKLSKALVTAIDGVAQAKQRLRKIELENQEKAEQIRQSEKKAEQEYQAKRQELAIAAQKAAQESQRAEMEQEKQNFELERQRLLFQIEQEKQKLELERQQVALEKERLELFNTRMSYLIEIAGKMVDMLQPHTDQSTRAMLIQTMLPDLLQLQNGEGLELALPVPQGSEEKTETKQNG